MKSRTTYSGLESCQRSASRRIAEGTRYFDVISDNEGSIAFGWVAPGILYTQFNGGLSASTGQEFAADLGAMMADVKTLMYFCDASQVRHYDLLARSAFVRIILKNKPRFASFVFLTRPQGLSSATRALSEVFGEIMVIEADVATFESRLLRKAPLAVLMIDSIPQTIALKSHSNREQQRNSRRRVE